MTARDVALLAALATALSALPASAQRESFTSSRDVALALDAPREEEGPALEVQLSAGDELRLDAPSAGDYVLPVMGIVVGALMVAGGAVVTLGGVFVLAIQSAWDRNTDSTELVVGLAGAGLALGAIVLTASAIATRDLVRRGRAAGRLAVGAAPLDGGAMVVVGGQF